MYIYDLEISMSKKNVPLNNELIDSIKEAINISNSSFSATRYCRTIKFIKQIDEFKLHIQMNSKESINPTRSVSSLSRALVKYENERQSELLEDYIYNGSVFITKLLSSHEDATSYISDTEMVQEIISMIFNQTVMNNRDKNLSKEYTEQIRSLVIDYRNKKTI